MRHSMPAAIVMADDDPDNRELAHEAFAEARFANPLHFVRDGQELLDFLRGTGAHPERSRQPEPCLVLLDLNMPRMGGHEALAEIRADAKLRHIPVVVLTTSKAEEDVVRSYQLGANSYIVKPVTFAELVEVVRDIGRYWFHRVELPGPQCSDPT